MYVESLVFEFLLYLSSKGLYDLIEFLAPILLPTRVLLQMVRLSYPNQIPHYIKDLFRAFRDCFESHFGLSHYM